MSFLLDTNVISELSRPIVNPGVATWAQQTQSAAISVVTIEEIEFGLSWKPNPRIQGLFRGLLSRLRILDVTMDIAAHAGRMRGLLQANGKVRTPADMLIAATAAVNNLTLVTRNVRDFDACGIVILNPFSS